FLASAIREARTRKSATCNPQIVIRRHHAPTIRSRLLSRIRRPVTGLDRDETPLEKVASSGVTLERDEEPYPPESISLRPCNDPRGEPARPIRLTAQAGFLDRTTITSIPPG